VAAAFGASVGGLRPVIFMKDAGLGHCLDALLTTFVLAELPYLMIVATSIADPPVAHHEVWATRLAALIASLGARSVDLTSTTTAGLKDLLRQAAATNRSLILIYCS